MVPSHVDLGSAWLVSRETVVPAPEGLASTSPVKWMVRGGDEIHSRFSILLGS
jgi:hypothetical protein